MIPIVKSPQYERDMMEIWDHIAQHNPHRALTWLQDCAEPCGAIIWSIIASAKTGWRSCAPFMAVAMSLLSNFMTEHPR